MIVLNPTGGGMVSRATAGGCSMQSGSLVLTRRGIRVVEAGLASCVAGFLLLLLLPMVPLFGAAAVPAARVLRTASEWALWAGPILMAVGVFLGAAAPGDSGVGPRALSTLVLVAALGAWAPFCYAADLSATFLDGSAGHLRAFLPMVLAIGFATMLAALCRWVAAVERRDVEDAAPTEVVGHDTEDVVVWEALAGRSARLVWWGVVFLLVALALDQAMPMLGSLGLGPREAAIVAVIVFPLVVVWGLALVVRLLLLAGAVIGAMRGEEGRAPGADAAWLRVPPERVGPAAWGIGLLAAASFVGDAVAQRTLGPEWRRRHLGEELAVAGSAVGRRVPDMVLRPLEGEVIRLTDLRGRIVVLNFWATWCPPCLAELGDLARLSRDLERDGGVLVGISAEDEATLRRFLAARPLPYPIVSAADWPPPFDAVQAIPVTYVIDAEGTIVEQFVGGRDEEAFREAVRKARAAPVGGGMVE